MRKFGISNMLSRTYPVHLEDGDVGAGISRLSPKRTRRGPRHGGYSTAAVVTTESTEYFRKS